MDTPLPAQPAASDPVAEFEAEFVAGLESEDDFAVRELLAGGWPVYYVEDDTPAGLIVKEHPDGRRQWVSGAGADERVIRDLSHNPPAALGGGRTERSGQINDRRPAQSQPSPDCESG